MTTISSISSYNYTSTYKSSLDTNGDGTVSAEELAAAKPKTSSSTETVSSLGSALEKLSAVAAEALLQLGSASQARNDDAPDANEMLASLDTNGDGVLDAGELEAGRPAGPPPGGASAGADDETSDESLAEGLTILQSIIQEYLENLGDTADLAAGA